MLGVYGRPLKAWVTVMAFNDTMKAETALPNDVFKVWKEYERVAMHFNTLLIRLRTQSLGGVAVLAALASVIVHGPAGDEPRWGVLALAFLLLCPVWLAIWILDFCYYNRLLLGAVEALVEVEGSVKQGAYLPSLQLSTTIERKVGGYCGRGGVGRWLFYSIVMLGLLVGAGASLAAFLASRAHS